LTDPDFNSTRSHNLDGPKPKLKVSSHRFLPQLPEAADRILPPRAPSRKPPPASTTRRLRRAGASERRVCLPEFVNTSPAGVRDSDCGCHTASIGKGLQKATLPLLGEFELIHESPIKVRPGYLGLRAAGLTRHRLRLQLKEKSRSLHTGVKILPNPIYIPKLWHGNGVALLGETYSASRRGR